VLRAYDAKGNFDETTPRPLWMIYRPGGRSEQPGDESEHPTDEQHPQADESEQQTAEPLQSDESAQSSPEQVSGSTPPTADDDRKLLAAYGESELAIRNIPLGSGTIKVRGSGVPAGHTVWVAGQQVPVDGLGNFAAETILPTGAQSVEVAMLDEEGSGTVFLRDLELKRKDWFYVGVADVTVSENSTNGPAKELQGTNAPQPYDSTVDGRLAFYVNGKFGDHWKLTASADTNEGPIEDLFSNLLDKSPDSLFRRIDPDYHYPTFGDDATVDEMAPTMGKFYVKLSQHENYGLWGNFKVGYMQNELAQVDRGLYGANLHYEAGKSTAFGEQRYAVGTPAQRAEDLRSAATDGE